MLLSAVRRPNPVPKNNVQNHRYGCVIQHHFSLAWISKMRTSRAFADSKNPSGSVDTPKQNAPRGRGRGKLPQSFMKTEIAEKAAEKEKPVINAPNAAPLNPVATSKEAAPKTDHQQDTSFGVLPEALEEEEDVEDEEEDNGDVNAQELEDLEEPAEFEKLIDLVAEGEYTSATVMQNLSKEDELLQYEDMIRQADTQALAEFGLTQEEIEEELENAEKEEEDDEDVEEGENEQDEEDVNDFEGHSTENLLRLAEEGKLKTLEGIHRVTEQYEKKVLEDLKQIDHEFLSILESASFGTLDIQKALAALDKEEQELAAEDPSALAQLNTDDDQLTLEDLKDYETSVFTPLENTSELQQETIQQLQDQQQQEEEEAEDDQQALKEEEEEEEEDDDDIDEDELEASGPIIDIEQEQAEDQQEMTHQRQQEEELEEEEEDEQMNELDENDEDFPGFSEKKADLFDGFEPEDADIVAYHFPKNSEELLQTSAKMGSSGLDWTPETPVEAFGSMYYDTIVGMRQLFSRHSQRIEHLYKKQQKSKAFFAKLKTKIKEKKAQKPKAVAPVAINDGFGVYFPQLMDKLPKNHPNYHTLSLMVTELHKNGTFSQLEKEQIVKKWIYILIDRKPEQLERLQNYSQMLKRRNLPKKTV
jgi:hypothetical protein